jgi:hypothetical protein
VETPVEIRARWRYLRELLMQQLGRFESGVLQMHANELDVTEDAIAKLKRNIQVFDELIERSEAREIG